MNKIEHIKKGGYSHLFNYDLSINLSLFNNLNYSSNLSMLMYYAVLKGRLINFSYLLKNQLPTQE